MRHDAREYCHGNSAAYWFQKAIAYSKALDELWIIVSSYGLENKGNIVNTIRAYVYETKLAAYQTSTKESRCLLRYRDMYTK